MPKPLTRPHKPRSGGSKAQNGFSWDIASALGIWGTTVPPPIQEFKTILVPGVEWPSTIDYNRPHKSREKLGLPKRMTKVDIAHGFIKHRVDVLLTEISNVVDVSLTNAARIVTILENKKICTSVIKTVDGKKRRVINLV